VSHACHANGCTEEIPPRLFMCLKHWHLVPQRLRDTIWREYVPGQEVRKDPTPAYLHAADTAIREVSSAEARARETVRYLTKWRR